MKGALFCVLFCAVLGIVVADDPVGICGLPGFNLSDLHLGQYWNFTVTNPTENCLHEYNASDIASCTVYFSICKPLPKEICGGIDNVSYCQVVTAKNGDKKPFVIGNYSIAHKFNAGVDGFGGIRDGYQYSAEQECGHSPFKTTINFECDLSATYTPGQPDLSKYLSSATRIACINVYNLKYSGGCYQQPTLAPSHCTVFGYNTTAISTKDYFTAQVEKNKCINFQDNCMILMAFCHPLPLNISNNCSNPESAVCQANKVISADESWSMGAYDNITIFHENTNYDFGFYVSYMNGSAPSGDTNCNNGIRTVVVFLCDEAAQWINTDVTFYVDVNYDAKACAYEIVARYDGACYETHNLRGSTSIVKTSFIGWIFIGIFMFCVLTYLVVGSAFQYFVRKERGLKVIPNYDFWKDFLLLTLEGCKFTLDVITCNRFGDGTTRGGAAKYDQL